MTTTLTTVRSRSETAPSVDVVRTATRRLLVTISALDVDDHRWRAAGQLVSSAALSLREAIGTPVAGCLVDAPPIVRERDLSMAAHRLLARDVRIENEQAAQQFIQLALHVTVALS
jgi:hypothetical protein